MPNKKRGTCLNYKRIIIALILFALIIALGAFKITNFFIDRSNSIEEYNGYTSQETETRKNITIPKDITINFVAIRRHNVP